MARLSPPGGQLVTASKKHLEGMTRAEAEAALGKLREQVAIERADERAAEDKRAAEEQGRTLAEVGKALIAAKRAVGRKPSTIEAYSYWLRIHIIDFFGPMPVSDIGREDVRGFAAALNARGSRRSRGRTRWGRSTR